MKRLFFPLVFLLITLGLKINSVREALFTGEKIYPYLNAVFWFFLAVFVIRLVDVLLHVWYARRKVQFPMPRVLHTITMAILYLSALFVILKGILSINITPFLATSALLTMILGLALQGVLSNLISGLSLHFTKSFGKGDWVEVASEEGVVIDTNWRETRIFNREYNIVIIPNNTMASEKITNFSYPNKKTAITIPVKAGYNSAPTEVFAALCEAAADVPSVLERPAPEAHLLEHGDLGTTYRVKFWISDFANKYQIMADVGRNIWFQFKRRNLEIPVPLSDKLQEVVGSIKPKQGITKIADKQERFFHSLLNSNFLRYQEGEKEGELLVTEDEVRALARTVRCLRFAPGEVVCRQGEKGESCYIVISGRINGEIIYEEKGKKYSSNFKVEPSRLFGEMSLFTGMPRTATGIIDVDSELLEINAVDFARLLEWNPALAEVMADLVSRRNKKNQKFLKKIKELSAQDIEESVSKKSILARLKSLISR